MKKTLLCIITIIVLIFACTACDINTLSIDRTLPLDSGTNTNTNTIIDESDNVTLDYLGQESDSQNYNYAQIIAENKMSAVININCTLTTTYESYSAAGTGFIITTDGYVITNAHVILCEYNLFTTRTDRWGNTITQYNGTDTAVYDNIYASFENGPDTFYILEVVDYNADLDIAVLKFKNSFQYYTDSTKSATASGFQRICGFKNSNNISYGEPVVAIGNAQGYGLSVTAGIISMPLNNTFDAIQTNTAINPGNSGGPLFNIKSQVLGVVSSKIVTSTVENMGYAIPSNKIVSYIDSVNEANSVTINYVYSN